MSDTEEPPTFGELFTEALAKVARYSAAIKRVMELHSAFLDTDTGLLHCKHCYRNDLDASWPCATRRAIDDPGEADPGEPTT